MISIGTESIVESFNHLELNVPIREWHDFSQLCGRLVFGRWWIGSSNLSLPYLSHVTWWHSGLTIVSIPLFRQVLSWWLSSIFWKYWGSSDSSSGRAIPFLYISQGGHHSLTWLNLVWTLSSETSNQPQRENKILLAMSSYAYRSGTSQVKPVSKSKSKKISLQSVTKTSQSGQG